MKTSTPTPAVPQTPTLRFLVIALVVLFIVGLAIFLVFALIPKNKKDGFVVADERKQSVTGPSCS